MVNFLIAKWATVTVGMFLTCGKQAWVTSFITDQTEECLHVHSLRM